MNKKTFDLKDSIPNAKEFKTYEIANKAEKINGLLVDSLSNEQIEIHPNIDEMLSTKYRDEFNKKLTDFINNNNIDCKIKLHREMFIKNKKLFRLQYAVLSNINCHLLNGEMS